MPQSIAGVFIVAAQQVHKKYVFPRTPAQRPRLDLAQADVAQREHAERLEQRSRNILDAEGQRRLVRASWRPRLSSLDQKEARKVLLVILNPGLQNLSRIHFGGAPAGDPRRVAQALGYDMLHASRGVVERHRFELGVRGKQVAALFERHGMREYAPDVSEPGARQRNQVVHDAQAKLADDVHVAAEQEIKMFGDGTGQRVLDRNYRAVDRPPLHPVEDLER